MEEQNKKNPWLGLESYKEGEILYGRDDDIRDLTQCVLSDIDTLLYGRSGIGKSSILNAGIIPAARRNGYLPVLVRFSLIACSTIGAKLVVITNGNWRIERNLSNCGVAGNFVFAKTL